MALRLEWMMVVALAAGGCAAGSLDRTVHRGGLDTRARLADVPVKGFTVEVSRYPYAATRDNVPEIVVGELLAEDEQSLWLMLGTQPTRIPLRDISRVQFDLYPSDVVINGIWTGLGTVSTLSHGWWLVFSAPTWLVTGISSTIADSLGSRAVVDAPLPVGALKPFARFPQGMPASLGGPPPPEEGAPLEPGPQDQL